MSRLKGLIIFIGGRVLSDAQWTTTRWARVRNIA